MNPSFLVPAVGNSVPELGATFSVSSATNIFLTAASLGLQSISITSLGQSVFLPPSYAVVPGQTKYGIKNNGVLPFGVRDVNGLLLTSITPGGYATFSLDNSSNWVFTGSGLEIGLVTLDNTFSSTFASTVIAPFVALDNNTSIHFAALASGFSAFVVDNLGKVISTPVTVDATASSLPSIGFKVTATTAIVFYGSSTTNNAVVILTLTGASPSYSISVGTSQNINSETIQTARWDGENFVSFPKIAQLTSTLYAATFFSSTGVTSTCVVAISVSGAAITVGTVVQVVGGSPSINSVIFPLTSTTAFIWYKSPSSPAPITNFGVVITITGVVCVVGTPQALTGLTSTVVTTPAIVQLSPTKILLQDNNNVSGSVIVSTYTISGTTVTAGTALSIETGTGANSFYVTNSASRYNPHLWAIGPNTAGLWYFDSSGISRVLILTESGGTLTAGTTNFRSISSAAVNSSDSGTLGPQGFPDMISMRNDGVTGAWKTRVEALKISGTSITNGTTYPLLEIPNTVDVSGSGLTVSRMTTGDYVTVSGNPSGLTSIAVFRTNGDYVNYRGRISVATIIGLATSPLAAYPAVASNRLVILGTTSTEGTSVSAAVAQLRLLNVEIAQ